MITWMETILAHQHSAPLLQAEGVEGEKKKGKGKKKLQKPDTQIGEVIKEDH